MMFCSGKDLQSNGTEQPNVTDGPAASSDFQQGSVNEDYSKPTAEEVSCKENSSLLHECSKGMEQCMQVPYDQELTEKVKRSSNSSAKNCGFMEMRKKNRTPSKNDDGAKNLRIRESTNEVGKLFDDNSVNFEEILRSHGVLKNTTFSKTSNLDRMLATESRMSSIRSKLTLSVATTNPTLATRSSPNRTDLQWLSNHTSPMNAIKSPTFSMADISVIIPPSMAAGHCESNSLKFNADFSETELQSDLADVLLEGATNVPLKNSAEKSKSKITSSLDSNGNAEIDGNSILKTKNCHKRNRKVNLSSLSGTEDQIDEKCKKNPTTHSTNKTVNKCFDNMKSPSDQKISDHGKHFQKDVKGQNNGLEKISTCTIANSGTSASCVVCTVKNASGDCNNDSRLNLSSPDDTKTELNELAEWKFVESARNKQKRKQTRTIKSNSIPPASNVSMRHTSQVSTHPKKNRNIEKTSSHQTTTLQSSKSVTLSSGQQAVACASLNLPVEATTSRKIMLRVDEKSSVGSADVMLVPVANENGLKPDDLTRTNPKVVQNVVTSIYPSFIIICSFNCMLQGIAISNFLFHIVSI